jgi:hypothetical protein
MDDDMLKCAQDRANAALNFMLDFERSGRKDQYLISRAWDEMSTAANCLQYAAKDAGLENPRG